MNINFNDFNFEVIDITTHGISEVTINQNGMNFSKRLVDDMGNPQYVRTLLDPEKRIFCIQACKQTDEQSIKFSKPRNEQKGGVTIACNPLMNVLRTLMANSWDKKHRYRIVGKTFHDSKATVFYLDAAEETPLYKVKKDKIATE